MVITEATARAAAVDILRPWRRMTARELSKHLVASSAPPASPLGGTTVWIRRATSDAPARAIVSAYCGVMTSFVFPLEEILAEAGGRAVQRPLFAEVG